MFVVNWTKKIANVHQVPPFTVPLDIIQKKDKTKFKCGKKVNV